MQAHCCGADKLFDLAGAEKEKRRYLKKGAHKATETLVGLMTKSVSPNFSLLDIGGGIGSIALRFSGHHLSQYTSVDASSGYQQVAKELIGDSHIAATRFIMADFVEVAPQINLHDHVTLDKVICCYPQVDNLLVSAAGKCNGQLGLVYPPSGWLSRVFRNMANGYLWLRGNPFRTFIHSERKIQRILENQGFKRTAVKISFPWRVEVWQRIMQPN